MATLEAPSASLNAAVLSLFRHADLRSGPNLIRDWSEFLDRVDDRQAQHLPTSVDRVLPLLEADERRLKAVTNLVVSLDLYEAEGALVALANRTASPAMVLAAAWFEPHPGVSPAVAEAAAELRNRVPLSEVQRESFAIRVDPLHEPRDPSGARLRTSAWPGIARPDSPSISVVESEAPFRLMLRVVSELALSGLRIRRIPAEPLRPIPHAWFQTDAPVIAWTPQAVSLLRQSGLVVDAGSLLMASTKTGSVGQLVSSLARRRGVSPREPRRDSFLSTPQALDPELMALGSLDAKDMSYLGGGRITSLYGLARRDELVPRHAGRSDRFPIWSFSQLVAYRTWRHFQTRSPKRRFPTELVHQLEDLAVAPVQRELGVSSDGHLLELRDDAWHDRINGQQVISETLSFDTVFEPFRLGNGVVPDLLSPSDQTVVNPAILGGTPFLRDSRISARAIAEISRRQGPEAVRDAFPQLSKRDISDATSVGLEILLVK